MKKVSSITSIAAVFATMFLFVASNAYADTPTLSQSTVTVGLGQSVNVVSQASSASVYMASNSNPLAALVQTNGNQVTVTGTQLGSTTVNICYVGTASDCTNLLITVDNSVTSSGYLSLDNTNPSITVGQATTVNISGGSGYYVSANSNSNVASQSLSGSALTITGLQSGSTTITVCSSSNGCSSVNVTVGSANTNQPVTFGVTNPTLTVGQSTNVSLSGGSGYFISSNSNNNAVQASVSGASLSLYGANAGSSSITVCQSSGGCATLNATVTASQTTPIVTQTVTQNSSISEFLAAVKAMQNQLVQILTQIQSMTGTLTRLTANLVAVLGNTQTSASNTSSYTFTQFLSVGSKSAEVTTLQQKLTSLGFYDGPVTGYFGPLTEAAVIRYQTARGIASVGYIGPSTRASLNSE